MFEEAEPELRRLPRGAVPSMISHRWLTKTDPDPKREQFALIMSHPRSDDFFWYDYSCMPQSGSNRDVQEVLDTLDTQVKASRFIVLRKSDDDYYHRGWCYHEWFTAQFVGCVERSILSFKDRLRSDEKLSAQQVDAKCVADRLISGDPEPLDSLEFSVDEDRRKVIESTKRSIAAIQEAIVDRLLGPLFDGLKSVQWPTPPPKITGLARERFARLADFVTCWARFLQPVEPVSPRITVFLSASHADAFLRCVTPAVSASMMSYIQRKWRKRSPSSEAELELERCFDYCSRRFPERCHVVVALLCQCLARKSIRQ